MSGKLPIIGKSQYVVETETTVGLDRFPINTNGKLKAVNVILQDVGTDIFINVEVNYKGQNTQVALIPGKYLKQNFSVSWHGSLPVDINTELIFEHLQGSGENKLIELTAVIQPD